MLLRSPHISCNSDRYAFTPINPEIIAKLHLTSEDRATQEIVTTPKGPGILILPKRSKNMVTGNHHEANNQDYDE
jgi:hypothetical protein